jgi:hypothetical protein
MKLDALFLAQMQQNFPQVPVKRFGHWCMYGLMREERVVKAHLALLGEVDELIQYDEVTPPDVLAQ